MDNFSSFSLSLNSSVASISRIITVCTFSSIHTHNFTLSIIYIRAIRAQQSLLKDGKGEESHTHAKFCALCVVGLDMMCIYIHLQSPSKVGFGKGKKQVWRIRIGAEEKKAAKYVINLIKEAKLFDSLMMDTFMDFYRSRLPL